MKDTHFYLPEEKLDRFVAQYTPNEDGTIPLYHPYSWSVPGTVDGWFELHERFGKLPMRELLAPAIRAAEQGEPVPQVIAAAWQRGGRLFADKPGFAATFLPGGRAPFRPHAAS